MNRRIFLLLAAAIVLLSSCAKEGPQGIPGPKGDSGTIGPPGPSGVAGSQIYSGTGAPPAGLGNAGDYYLNKSNGNFYGPKTVAGWGTPIVLGGSGTGGQGPAGPAGPQGATGATGATGAAGSQIYSGSGTPASSLGKTGDYYIDVMHAVLYGPKTAGGWPATGLSLQVNNTITYDFVNKVQHNLPYSWAPVPIGSVYTGTTDVISLPYNNAAAQTQGFTIPQAIVDNGIVLAYIRYFSGGPNDTATDAGMTPWYQMPYTINGFTGQVGVYNISIVTRVDLNAFTISLTAANSGVGNYIASVLVPAVIRIVLIPAGQVTTIQQTGPEQFAGMSNLFRPG